MYYRGILSEQGNIVEESEAFDYALKRVLSNEEEKAEFVEWYYSGNWIETEDEESD